MITVTNNSVQQINAALIALKNETNAEIRSELKEISNTIEHTTEINNPFKFPEGYIYMQLYNPTLASWEKSPIQLGMTPASGCRWEEITSDFANYPYLKIGSGTTQTGHNAYHNHGGYTGYSNPRHAHSQNVTANAGGTAVRRDYASDGSSYSYPQGCTTDYADINHRHGINYDGDSTEQTNEVNASKVKMWKVVEDV